MDVPYNGNPDLVRPVEGAEQCVRDLRRAGLKVGVISNQSGVGRGMITVAQVEQVNRKVEEIFGPFDVVLYCPHAPGDGCTCRKPMPGMIHAAARRLAIQPAQCAVVGDKQSDVDAATAAGARAFFVTTPLSLARACEAILQHRVDENHKP